MFGDVSAAPLELAEVVDGVVGYRITVPVATQRFTFDLYLDTIAVRSGRSIAGLSLQTQARALSLAELDGFVAVAAGRLTS